MLVWGLETSSQPGGRWIPQGPMPSSCTFVREHSGPAVSLTCWPPEDKAGERARRSWSEALDEGNCIRRATGRKGSRAPGAAAHVPQPRAEGLLVPSPKRGPVSALKGVEGVLQGLPEDSCTGYGRGTGPPCGQTPPPPGSLPLRQRLGKGHGFLLGSGIRGDKYDQSPTVGAEVCPEELTVSSVGHGRGSGQQFPPEAVRGVHGPPLGKWPISSLCPPPLAG